MNQRGKTTPAMDANAIVITTGSAINPRKAFGKPSSEACHDAPTTLQEILALMSHENTAFGFAARVMASAESTSEATSAKIEEINISLNAPIWRARFAIGANSTPSFITSVDMG
ncbi:unannotated protein [freshwater metagenome]|uniref:Unannotated protein n=1 Tax=freshwater metagenome TaxID=449393 RepID=A0A6J6MQY5_9ZZZZ